ncbi:hypothetical protein D3C73_1324360 [compost metagenome]
MLERWDGSHCHTVKAASPVYTTDQMEKAGVAGARRVESAAKAPPAACAMGVPPNTPTPIIEPTMQTTKLTVTAICRLRSELRVAMF